MKLTPMLIGTFIICATFLSATRADTLTGVTTQKTPACGSEVNLSIFGTAMDMGDDFTVNSFISSGKCTIIDPGMKVTYVSGALDHGSVQIAVPGFKDPLWIGFGMVNFK